MENSLQLGNHSPHNATVSLEVLNLRRLATEVGVVGGELGMSWYRNDSM